MLDPNYLLHISEGAEEIAEKLHTDIVNRMVERIMYRLGRGDDYILTAQDKWQIQTLQDAGYLLEDIQKEIAKATKLQQTEVAEAMEEAGVKALEYDDKIYQNAGLSPVPLTQSPQLIRLMQRTYEATMGEWVNFTRTTANEAQRAYISALDNAYTLVSSGAMSYTQAVKEAVEHIVSSGVEVTYPTGHKDTIETATLRAVRTGVSQATAQIQIARMDEMGVDLVITSSHLGARPSHQEWQGKIFSRRGNSKYPDFVQSTGYGSVSGLCGANCRHSFGPYFEGMDNPYEQFDSEENQAQYDLEQRQRTLERRIRNIKREAMGLKTSVDACKDDKAKFTLDMEYQKKAALLKKQTEAYNQFCEENGLKPLRDRINTAKWDREQAAAARGAAKRYENHTLHDSTDKWAKEAKKELLLSEKSLAARKKEVAEIYSADGKYLFTKRGSVDEISFTSKEFRRLRDTVITHNHPTGGSFSPNDIWLLKKSNAAEIRAITENGVYFIRQPQKWSIEINSLEKIKIVREEIKKDVVRKYGRLYNQGVITKVERFQLSSDELNRRFAERYGFEYGKEVFKD